jgi:hypothetical protein
MITWTINGVEGVWMTKSEHSELVREIDRLRSLCRGGEQVANKSVRGLHSFPGTPDDDDPSWVCDFPGCRSIRSGQTRYCKLHRMRYERHGDPAVVLQRGRKKATNDNA